jgi:hypothetical protein
MSERLILRNFLDKKEKILLPINVINVSSSLPDFIMYLEPKIKS